MKKQFKAYADIGSHGGIFEFISGPVAMSYPHLMHIYSEKISSNLIEIKITYDIKTRNNKRCDR